MPEYVLENTSVLIIHGQWQFPAPIKSAISFRHWSRYGSATGTEPPGTEPDIGWADWDFSRSIGPLTARWQKTLLVGILELPCRHYLRFENNNFWIIIQLGKDVMTRGRTSTKANLLSSTSSLGIVTSLLSAKELLHYAWPGKLSWGSNEVTLCDELNLILMGYCFTIIIIFSICLLCSICISTFYQSRIKWHVFIQWHSLFFNLNTNAFIRHT